MGSWPLSLRRALCALVSLLIAVSAQAVRADESVKVAQARMLEIIAWYAERTPHAVPGGRIAARVMEAMARVPRHAFVPETLRDEAYSDRPLAIGYGQTISQPFIVALMTDLLRPKTGDVMLEIGTGSGYQAAVLGELVQTVCTIEIIPGLAESASERLQAQDYANVETRVGDGYYGWQDCGPFDGIVITAAASHVPPPLIDQLKPGGRMVIPVGDPFTTQQLTLVVREPDGGVTTRQLLPVQFVPFTRKQP